MDGKPLKICQKVFYIHLSQAKKEKSTGTRKIGHVYHGSVKVKEPLKINVIVCLFHYENELGYYYKKT